MREAIRMLVDAEETAKLRVRSARQLAEQQVDHARKETAERVARARQQAQAEAEELLRAACLEAERDKQQALTHATTRIQADIRVDADVFEQAVDAVMHRLCGG